MSNKSQFEKIYRLYFDEKLTVPAIAENLGITRQAVYYNLRSRNCQLRPRKGNFNTYNLQPAIPKDELEDLYLGQKLTLAEVSRRIGRSRDVVRKTMIEHGIPIKRPTGGVLRNFDEPDISSLGIGDQIIVKTVNGIPPNTYLAKRAKKLGIRIVIRSIGDKSFAVIRTPLLAKDQLKAFKNDGLSVTVIAAKYLAGRKTIVRLFRDYGLV